MALDRHLTGKAMIDALMEQGIADHNTQRVIIDIPIDGIPLIYIQKLGTRHLLNIVSAIRDSGYEIQQTVEDVLDVTTHGSPVNEYMSPTNDAMNTEERTIKRAEDYEQDVTTYNPDKIDRIK